MAQRQTAAAPLPAVTTAAEPGGLLDQVIERTAERVDALAGQYQDAIAKAQGHTRRALLLARGVQVLRETLTPEVMALIRELENRDYGYQTDRGPGKGKQGTDSPPYPAEVVKGCVITALLQGFFLTGNEFNIIAGRFYGTQAGYRRKLEAVAGISDIEVAPGVPQSRNGHAVVRVALSWALRGKRQQLRGPDGDPGGVFAVLTRPTDGADQTIGKALRKAYKLAYQQATGSIHVLDEPEGDEEPSPAEEASQEPVSRPEEGPRSELEAMIAKHGLAAVGARAVERLAEMGIPEARVLAAVGLSRRADLTGDHLWTLRQKADLVRGGEHPDQHFPPPTPPPEESWEEGRE